MRILVFFLCMLLGSGVVGNIAAANEKARQDIKLVLQITVDGLRADLLNRYQASFGKDGFRFLLRQGTVYANAQYQHANTETIVGHTTLATGTFPSQHGMGLERNQSALGTHAAANTRGSTTLWTSTWDPPYVAHGWYPIRATALCICIGIASACRIIRHAHHSLQRCSHLK